MEVERREKYSCRGPVSDIYPLLEIAAWLLVTLAFGMLSCSGSLCRTLAKRVRLLGELLSDLQAVVAALTASR